MKSWFRREAEHAAPSPDPDSPVELSSALDEVVARVNRTSGRLPVAAVVAALDVTDIVRELLDSTFNDAVPEVQVILAVRGIVHDYLPTTLDRFLALDPGRTDVASSVGATPRGQVVEQLLGLTSAAADVLVATRERDADHLVTQGNFLRTKFSRSDLDL